jgi:hypothetical protein
LGIVGVIVGGFAFALWLQRPGVPADDSEMSGPTGFLLLVSGGFLLFLGAGAYALVLGTNCFTFNLNEPYFSGFSKRFWVANVLVGFLMQGGIGFMAAPVIAPLVARIIPVYAVLPVAILIPFCGAIVFFIWFQMWTPLIIAVSRQRLYCSGFSPEQIASGTYTGISNPVAPSPMKALMEDDFGMLWFTPQLLMYRGDSSSFDLRRDQIVEVQRKATGRAMSAYFGAVHLIIRYIDVDGTEKQVMLHPETPWTLTGLARAFDQLAERIEQWRQAMPIDAPLPAPALTTMGS